MIARATAVIAERPEVILRAWLETESVRPKARRPATEDTPTMVTESAPCSGVKLFWSKRVGMKKMGTSLTIEKMSL